MANDVARLPMPSRLEPTSSRRTLASYVRVYFYSLYNAADAKFRDLLASIGNKDAVNGNRVFDRHDAVRLIKKAAVEAKDTVTASAKDGDIYRCMVNLMRDNGLGLKLRRQQYQQLTHQAPAE